MLLTSILPFFSTMFSTGLKTNTVICAKNSLSTANAFNLAGSRILLLGKERGKYYLEN